MSANAYNPMTHCCHGKSYKVDECAECEKVWADEVLLPDARKTVAQLMKFYSVHHLVSLVFAQNHHVEKLQDKLGASQ